MKNKNLFLRVWKSETSKVKTLADLVSSEGQVPSL